MSSRSLRTAAAAALTLAALLVTLTGCDEKTREFFSPTIGPEPPVVPEDGSIMGTVTVDGSPRSGVTVTLDGGETTTTDGQGMYTFDPVEPGQHTVAVTPPEGTECDPESRTVDVPEGDKATADFDCTTLPPEDGSIMGTVTVDGSPRSGVTVTLDGGETTTTDGQGMYTFDPVEPGQHTVAVTPPEGTECDPESRTVDVPEGDKATADFDCTTLPPEDGRITGTVTTDGSPQPGATVTLDGGEVTSTDAQGTYTFDPVSPGQHEVSVMVEGAECEPASRSVDVPEGGEAVADFDCTTPTEDFTTSLDDGYRHDPPGSDPPSVVCGKISTDPSQPGASFEVTVTGPDVRGPVPFTGTLDDMGMATYEVGIGAFGDYSIEVEVTSDGVVSTTSATTSVTSSQSSCPS